METIGLLAGIGTLPVEFIEAVRPQGYRVVCIAVTPGVDPRLAAIADAYYDISAFKLDKVIKTLVKEHVKEVTMIGKVTKEWLYKSHTLPDMRAVRLLNRLRKMNFKDDTITLAIVDELAKDGISVLDQTKYLKPLMPGPQVFTKKKPTEAQAGSRCWLRSFVQKARGLGNSLHERCAFDRVRSGLSGPSSSR